MPRLAPVTRNTLSFSSLKLMARFLQCDIGKPGSGAVQQERQRALVEGFRLLELGCVAGVLDDFQTGARDVLAHFGAVFGRAGAVVTALDDQRRHADFAEP